MTLLGQRGRQAAWKARRSVGRPRRLPGLRMPDATPGPRKHAVAGPNRLRQVCLLRSVRLTNGPRRRRQKPSRASSSPATAKRLSAGFCFRQQSSRVKLALASLVGPRLFWRRNPATVDGTRRPISQRNPPAYFNSGGFLFAIGLNTRLANLYAMMHGFSEPAE